MKSGPARIAEGLLTHPPRRMRFSFDGRPLEGLAGDTLASALLANGVRLLGRSFKYHRPRGVVTCGPEEPCALVDVRGPQGREPNRLATTLALREGLCAESQNRWPSLRWDLLAINDRLARFLPAGFYYKTFMRPAWAWERWYEPLIRRAAGLGRLEAAVPAHSGPAQTVHDHADVLIVGAGAAGLVAAHALGSAGLRVILADQDVMLGGGTLLETRWYAWREAMTLKVLRLPGVRCLPQTAVVGAYGHGVFAALETLGAEESALHGGLSERLRVIRARSVVLATGGLERLIAFPGNDRPGVMLAGTALAYLRRYGVAVGNQPVFFVNSDEPYQGALALSAAGVPSTIVDVRRESLAAERARALGLTVHTNARVLKVLGRLAVEGVVIGEVADGARRRIAADCVLMSAGHSPLTVLASQLGASLHWQEALSAFVPQLAPAAGQVAGAAAGVSGLAAAARDGTRAAAAILATLGRVPPAMDTQGALPADPSQTPLQAVWEVPGRGKAFVDLQNDVTAADVRLACREGYEHVEHMKRYTTHAMATDQGRIGSLTGSAVLAAARDVPLAAVGQARPRPYTQPVPFAALAGPEIREHYRPKRRLPLHDWHESHGARFIAAGLWLRPLVYSTHAGWEPVLDEAGAVRRAVGMTDVSSLGKIDVQGADAALFLDFVYANRISTLAAGRARYGLMLREDGMAFDDGTVARLAATHFVLTTTTANSVGVLEHLEFQRETAGAHLDVLVSDIGEQWAQFAVAGPRAREVVTQVVSGLDLANAAFPFMAAGSAAIAGIPGRVFRISFSGELAYELAVPAAHALTAWSALLTAGTAFGLRVYGLDALNTLRIEKGHVTSAELNGNTSADDLGLARMLKKNADFIGCAFAAREDVAAGERLQLIGVRPLGRGARLRNGQQLVAPGAPAASLGYITSSTPSTELPGWVGLALLQGGRARIGEQLEALSPIHQERVAVRIVEPCQIDAESARVRA
jgi:methylglutamate dehydrogenase subunit C